MVVKKGINKTYVSKFKELVQETRPVVPESNEVDTDNRHNIIVSHTHVSDILRENSL